MTAKFIVDDLSHDKRLGRTKSIEKIVQNIKRFSPYFFDTIQEFFKNKKSIYLFTHVGRFIVYLQLNREMTVGDLIFFDTEKNIDKALDTVNFLFVNDPVKLNLFMDAYNRLEPFYDADYSLAELSLGDSVFN